MKITKEELSRRKEALYAILEECSLCPRHCGVNRLKGEVGACKTADKAVVSTYGAHFGEERPLVGTRGSGTVFFSWCNLRCIYCQNYEISHLGEGNPVTTDVLAFIFLSIKEGGCHNLNLVTPTHVIPFWVKALEIIEEETRFDIPIVYNCSGYEDVEVLRLLEGIVDIYMPDFKYWDEATARRLSGIKDYPEVAKRALKEMHRQVGDLVIDSDGVAKQGLLVRHLVLPGGLAGTKEVVRFIAEEISKDTYINIMDQYRPCGPHELPAPLNRRITQAEYQEAIDAARGVGLWRIDGMF